MLAGLSEPTSHGTRREYLFEPPYSRLDFEMMQALLEDATMYGLAATRFISNDRITVTTIGARA